MEVALASVALTRKHFGHHAVLKILPPDHQGYILKSLAGVFAHSTQFGNDSNYRYSNGENTATNCSMEIALASVGLTKKHFGHHVVLKILPPDHQDYSLKSLAGVFAHSTQFGNDSNYRYSNAENTATNCSTEIALASVGLTKKHFGHHAVLKILPPDHQDYSLKSLAGVFAHSTQFGNDSNYRYSNGENTATNCSMEIALASVGLTKKHFGHHAVLKIFPPDHQGCSLKSLAGVFAIFN